MTTATAPKKFHKAVREQIWTLTGLAGGTGSGKTYSALELATGMAGGERFAMIDTENGRGRHYADLFDYDIADLGAPFRPERYAEAIEDAAKEGYPVIVVDSFSHEHAGDGGLLDWHEEEFQRLGGRDAVKMTAWIQPKRAHKKMMTRLLQTNAHLIICLRAEEKVEMVKEDGKWVIVPKRSLVGTDGWVPIAEKNLPYELTTSFLLKADRPGFPIPIKLEEQHRKLVPLDRPLTRESGAALAAWAAGGKREASASEPTQPPATEAPEEVGPALASKEQKLALVKYAGERGLTEDTMRELVHEAIGRSTLRGDVSVEELAWISTAVDNKTGAA